MTEQTTIGAPNSTVEKFAYFWSRPDVNLLKGSFTEDVVAHFPGSEPARGPAEYVARITSFLEALPELRIEVADHATNGDVTFVRWFARPTGTGGPVEFHGIDCIRTRDGRVCENWVTFDTAAFDAAVSRRSKGGSRYDCPMTESAANPGNRTYRCASGQIEVSVQTEAQWHALAVCLGRPELAYEGSWEAVRVAAADGPVARVLEQHLVEEPADVWLRRLEANRVPARLIVG